MTGAGRGPHLITASGTVYAVVPVDDYMRLWAEALTARFAADARRLELMLAASAAQDLPPGVCPSWRRGTWA